MSVVWVDPAPPQSPQDASLGAGDTGQLTSVALGSVGKSGVDGTHSG